MLAPSRPTRLLDCNGCYLGTPTRTVSSTARRSSVTDHCTQTGTLPSPFNNRQPFLVAGCETCRRVTARWCDELVCMSVCLPKKGSPYSIKKRMVPELIPVLGSQPACDVSHKSGGRLPLLTARPAVTAATLEGCYQFCCLVNRGTMGVNSLPETVTRQRRGCDLNPGPSAFESSMLTTRLPSHTLLAYTVAYRKNHTPELRLIVAACFLWP